MTRDPDLQAIGRLLYSREQIAEAVAGLAQQIARDYAGKPLLLLGVLKGALYLTVDLSRALAQIASGPSQIVVEYVCTGSYGMSDRSEGQVRLLLDTAVPVADRDVLLVDDIADMGFTIGYLETLLKERGAATLRTCVLFDKAARRKIPARPDYVGLPVPDAFVVGYGLDYQELYRTLPYVAALRQSKESSSQTT